jgi:hypothetical protein
MGNQRDINDGAPWSELDIQDLKIAVKLGYDALGFGLDLEPVEKWGDRH